MTCQDFNRNCSVAQKPHSSVACATSQLRYQWISQDIYDFLNTYNILSSVHHTAVFLHYSVFTVH